MNKVYMCIECGETYDVDSIEKSNEFKCTSCDVQFGLTDIATNAFLDDGNDRVEAVITFMHDIMKLDVGNYFDK